ncbi:MAG: HAD-IIB family hydrolase [Clostridia bacterium]|nr:HAD-IIB family hydrolase [Clostridia bacterium]
MKIIASDYDGTVNYHGISDADKQAITKFREAGNKFGIVTGRDLEMALWILDEMKIEIDYLICCTGAIILDGKGNILYEKRQSVDIDRFNQIIDKAREFHFGNFSISDRLIRFYNDRRAIIPCELERISEFTQANVWFPSEENCIKFLNYLNTEHGDYIIGFRNGGSVDIPPKGISKPTGVHEYAKMFDNVDKIYAVGDNLNDIPMIKEFCGFAVSNAKDEVKNAAMHQCDRICDMIEAIMKGEA